MILLVNMGPSANSKEGSPAAGGGKGDGGDAGGAPGGDAGGAPGGDAGGGAPGGDAGGGAPGGGAPQADVALEKAIEQSF